MKALGSAHGFYGNVCAEGSVDPRITQCTDATLYLLLCEYVGITREVIVLRKLLPCTAITVRISMVCNAFFVCGKTTQAFTDTFKGSSAFLKNGCPRSAAHAYAFAHFQWERIFNTILLHFSHRLSGEVKAATEEISMLCQPLFGIPMEGKHLLLLQFLPLLIAREVMICLCITSVILLVTTSDCRCRCE